MLSLYKIEYRDSSMFSEGINKPDKIETVYAVAENEQEALEIVDEKHGFWNARSIEIIASEDECFETEKLIINGNSK